MHGLQLLVCCATLLAVALFPAFSSGQMSATEASTHCKAPGTGKGYPYSPIPSGSEPLSACQWNLQLIGVDSEVYAKATGKGVRVGVLTGVDFNHPDLAGAIDETAACSFVRLLDGYPEGFINPAEVGNGNCSNKAAVQDLGGSGTAVATIIAARLNGVGMAGVAPEATIVPVKVCAFPYGFCSVKSTADAIRYAGDLGLDVIVIAFYADPYYFYCKNDEEQRTMLKEMQDAVNYALQRGVVIVAAAQNDEKDLTHPKRDNITNACQLSPAELTGVITVSSVGPKPELAYNSNVGKQTIDVTGPGGDPYTYTEPDSPYQNVLGEVLAGRTSTEYNPAVWVGQTQIPYATVVDNGGHYLATYGTQFAAAHVAGVAALIRQLHPGLAPAAVKAILKKTATPLACPVLEGNYNLATLKVNCTGGPSKNSFYGAGIVNAKNAVLFKN